ncbi:hypothetical protein C6A86_023610 [Mycobacterium sp. ITM-2016-00316]|uniref:hypothetical protein n=1 Tax=Mycobacterium sp. ITM-2016-00316 TaxID=2099695 RepID=UPI000CF85A08|nr:hypothetical protein [Mycobacterium sp. ITM-2016-00316]WNG81148.1 hypothetical protein C6A86_023610 [Mycobacterium sp. ITM-2016-00316]
MELLEPEPTFQGNKIPSISYGHLSVLRHQLQTEYRERQFQKRGDEPGGEDSAPIAMVSRKASVVSARAGVCHTSALWFNASSESDA